MNTPEIDGMDGTRLARFISGECTEQERAEIQAWLDAEPSRRELLASLGEVWEMTGGGAESWDVDQAWQEFVARRSRRATSPRRTVKAPTRHAARARQRVAAWGLRAAAAALLVAGAAVVWSQLSGPERIAGSVEPREFTTGLAERADIDLPDGAHVTLAPQSRLQVAAGYGGAVRRVQLEGQAVFRVAHDPGRPFQVGAGGMVTEVLGTHFVVRAYADDPDVSVALAEGSVRVRDAGDEEGARALTLLPGQVARASAGESPRLDVEAGAATFLAWAEGRLVFEDTPLAEAALDLARWYDIDIRMDSESLARRRLTGTFQHEPVDRVLELIALSLNLRYDRDDRVVTLSER